MSFLPGKFRPPYLSKLRSIAMWRLVWDDTVYAPTQSCQKYIPSPSLNTDYLLSYWYHAYYSSLDFSLDVLHTLWCRLACRNSGVKFRNDRVKIQIWGKPAIFFSWAMSVYNEIRPVVASGWCAPRLHWGIFDSAAQQAWLIGDTLLLILSFVTFLCVL